jgi:hypothetical protein
LLLPVLESLIPIEPDVMSKRFWTVIAFFLSSTLAKRRSAKNFRTG